VRVAGGQPARYHRGHEAEIDRRTTDPDRIDAMPIPMTCACGRSLRVKDEFAGRKAKCPGCGTVLTVPLPEAEREEEALEVLLAEPPPDEAPPRSAVRAEPPPPGPEPRPRAEGPSRRKRLRDEPRDVPNVEKRRRVPAVAFEEGWFGSVNAGVAGGLLMMVIAVVWFVLGLMADRIFFFPPILLVIGLVAIIKGLFGGE
jgi:hypothetical protein